MRRFWLKVYRIYLRHPGKRGVVHSSLPAFCLVFVSLLVPVYYLFIELFPPAPDLSLFSFIMFSGPSFLLSAYFIFNIHSKLVAPLLDYLSSTHNPRDIWLWGRNAFKWPFSSIPCCQVTTVPMINCYHHSNLNRNIDSSRKPPLTSPQLYCVPLFVFS